jgi:hypothetical protein
VSPEVVASAPPLTVTSLNILGYPVDDATNLAALVWIIVQFLWWLYQRFKK